jgi:hypothetical protein
LKKGACLGFFHRLVKTLERPLFSFDHAASIQTVEEYRTLLCIFTTVLQPKQRLLVGDIVFAVVNIVPFEAIAGLPYGGLRAVLN